MPTNDHAAFWNRVKEIEANTANKFGTGTVDVPMALLEPDSVGLRSKVDKDKDDYKALAASIKDKGVMNAISVRKVGERFIVVDGLHRFTANEEAGHPTIPAVYYPNITADDVMWLQIIGNKNKVDTKPAQYGAQLQKIFALDTTLTQKEMARRLGQSESWIAERLKLAENLCEEAKQLVDAGSIPVSTAFQLASLEDHETQRDWLDRAQTLKPTEIIPLLHQAVQKEKKAKRDRNKSEKDEGFQPTPTLRKKPELIETLYNLQTEFKDEDVTEQDLEAVNRTSLEYRAGYAEGLMFALRLDKETVEEARQAAENEEAARQAKKADAERKRLQEKAVTEGLDKTILGKKVEIKGMPGHEPKNNYEPANS